MICLIDRISLRWDCDFWRPTRLRDGRNGAGGYGFCRDLRLFHWADDVAARIRGLVRSGARAERSSKAGESSSAASYRSTRTAACSRRRIKLGHESFDRSSCATPSRGGRAAGQRYRSWDGHRMGRSRSWLYRRAPPMSRTIIERSGETPCRLAALTSSARLCCGFLPMVCARRIALSTLPGLWNVAPSAASDVRRMSFDGLGAGHPRRVRALSIAGPWSIRHSMLRSPIRFRTRLAIVELEEGPRLATWVTGVPPEKLCLGMPVEVWFDAIDDKVALPKFKPHNS